MQYSTLAVLLPLAAAQTIRIDVGLDGLKFTPNNVVAAPGSQLEFHYHPKAHSVSQSSFAAPCVPLADGFNSGFVKVASGESPETFTVTVNDTKPIWVYCAQTIGNHCQSGMSMVINQPADPAKSLVAYQAAAAKVAISQILPVVEGGIFSGSGNSTISGGYGSNSTVSMGSPGASITAGTPGSGSTNAPGSGSGGASATKSGSATHTGAAVPGQVLDWAILGGAALLGAMVI